MSSDNALFIAHTPYHLVISYGLAAEQDAQSHLYIRPSAPNLEPLIDLFSATEVFDTVETLADPTDGENRRKSNRYWKRTVRENIRTLRGFLRTTDVQAVYAALDDREIVQAAMHFANRYGSASECYHIEDGCYDYHSRVTTWTPYRSDMLQQASNFLFFGFRWEPPPMVRGTSSQVSGAYVTHPDHVRRELRERPVHRIPANNVKELGQSKQLYEYFRQVDTSSESLSSIDAVILVPLVRSSDKPPEVTKLFDDIATVLDDAGYNVGVKYHPREIEPNRLRFTDSSNIEIIPKEIPLELFYASDETTVEVVLGRYSTALKSADWLLDDPTILSIYPLLDQKELTFHPHDRTDLMEMYDALGATLISETAQIEDAL